MRNAQLWPRCSHPIENWPFSGAYRRGLDDAAFAVKALELPGPLGCRVSRVSRTASGRQDDGGTADGRFSWHFEAGATSQGVPEG